jgi:ribosomal protein S18 acetylase RimI-like enzyme
MMIRDFRPADLDEVLWLNVRALNPDAPRQGDAQRYSDLLDVAGVYQRDGAFLVGEEDGAVVAMGAVRRVDASVFEMKRLRVAAHAVRRGFASAMVAELERRARALGGMVIILDTTVQQLAAQTLYQRLGYAETHRSHLMNDAGSFDLIHYRKEIASLPRAES